MLYLLCSQQIHICDFENSSKFFDMAKYLLKLFLQCKHHAAAFVLVPKHIWLFATGSSSLPSMLCAQSIFVDHRFFDSFISLPCTAHQTIFTMLITDKCVEQNINSYDMNFSSSIDLLIFVICFLLVCPYYGCCKRLQEIISNAKTVFSVDKLSMAKFLCCLFFLLRSTATLTKTSYKLEHFLLLLFLLSELECRQNFFG